MEFVFFSVMVIIIFAQYVITSINHPCFALSLTLIIQQTMLYPPGFSCDVTVFVLNEMANQFDDVRECTHCQLRLTLHFATHLTIFSCVLQSSAPDCLPISSSNVRGLGQKTLSTGPICSDTLRRRSTSPTGGCKHKNMSYE